MKIFVQKKGMRKKKNADNVLQVRISFDPSVVRFGKYTMEAGQCGMRTVYGGSLRIQYSDDHR